MPEKNNRTENLSEKDNSKKKKVANTKSSNSTNKKTTTSKKAPAKQTTKKVSETKKAVSSKDVKSDKKPAVKKTQAKANASAKKTTATKTTTTKKNVATSKTITKKLPQEKKVEKEAKVLEEFKPKESAIISKIKSFLKKIVEIQEEAKKENLVKKELEEKVKKEEVKEDKKSVYALEYYDLPYRYNETVVKILAQTPKRLFVYWDVSDADKERYLSAFGENFFKDTYPVLLIHNEEKNYTFEVPINDFANSWYLDVNDPKSKYTIQLGRKFREQAQLVMINKETIKEKNIDLQNDYLPITTSNTLEVPNDHILFENIKPYVVYRNVKNYEEKTVEVSNLEFAKKIGKIYNIYDVYKEIYKKEMEENCLCELLNPSSMSSSSFK